MFSEICSTQGGPFQITKMVDFTGFKMGHGPQNGGKKRAKSVKKAANASQFI